MAMKWVLQFLFIINFPCFLHAIDTDYPSANLSTIWINNDFIPRGSSDFVDGSTIRHVLLNNSNTVNFPAIGCGFYGNRTTNAFFFAVFAVQATSDSTTVAAISPQILWIANRANPVKENATLELTDAGDLVLNDADGMFVWSSNSSAKAVAQMNITGIGTILLVKPSNIFPDTSVIIWQSSDHPTDTWLSGQLLLSGQRLIAGVSASNWTPGPFYLSFVDNNLSAFIESNPPQMYRRVLYDGQKSKHFKTGSLEIIGPASETIAVRYVSDEETFRYLRLDPDGHLKVYQWVRGVALEEDDILTDNLGDCAYPTVCGNYGICSNAQCSCPVGNDGDSSYFKQLNSTPACIETTQLSCQSSHLHSFIELDNVSYFGFVTALAKTDIESCKQACLKNCSCKAALFQYNLNTSSGDCSLPSQIFSLMRSPQGLLPYHSTSFIKVQQSLVPSSPPLVAPSPHTTKSNQIGLTVVPIVAGLIFVFILIRICICVVRKRRSREEEGRKNKADEELLNSLNLLQNLPSRFTYNELKSMTDNFHKKLGGGGFGSVFEGTLSDGIKIAVKRLDRLGQGRKEFLAEVKTIGSIHHVNLVRLRGFCAENSHRLLVYEHMSNGSLDKWIFNRNPETALEWEIRKKIIFNIAKGLAYLHEDCRMRIAHLDIKPQNILLDENFDAKLSDFGLARLIDRNQSQVTTQIRGTRGYMAPEWLSRKITEKVDVYSFGVVILEVVCGRRNLEFSTLDEDYHLLLPIVKQKAEENRLFDLVDKCSEDMLQHGEEGEKMIRIAIWCLQSDSRRPSMSMVVKVLEGVMVMEPISDYSFLTSTVVKAPTEAVIVTSNPQPVSILSEPR